MMLTEKLRSELQKNYEPFSLNTTRHKGADIVFKADEEGTPVLLFIGRMTKKGWVKGKRFSRTLKLDSSGNVIKDDWELKGRFNYD